MRVKAHQLPSPIFESGSGLWTGTAVLTFYLHYLISNSGGYFHCRKFYKSNVKSVPLMLNENKIVLIVTEIFPSEPD